MFYCCCCFYGFAVLVKFRLFYKRFVEHNESNDFSFMRILFGMEYQFNCNLCSAKKNKKQNKTKRNEIVKFLLTYLILDHESANKTRKNCLQFHVNISDFFFISLRFTSIFLIQSKIFSNDLCKWNEKKKKIRVLVFLFWFVFFFFLLFLYFCVRYCCLWQNNNIRTNRLHIVTANTVPHSSESGAVFALRTEYTHFWAKMLCCLDSFGNKVFFFLLFSFLNDEPSMALTLEIEWFFFIRVGKEAPK